MEGNLLLLLYCQKYNGIIITWQVHNASIEQTNLWRFCHEKTEIEFAINFFGFCGHD